MIVVVDIGLVLLVITAFPENVSRILFVDPFDQEKMLAKKIIRQGASAQQRQQLPRTSTASSSESQWLLSEEQSPNPVPSQDSSDDGDSCRDEEESIDSEIMGTSYLKRSIWRKWDDDRLKIIYELDGSNLQKYWDLFDLLLNLIFCAWYIVLTWLSIGPRGDNRDSPAPPPPDQLYEDVDFVLGIYLKSK